MTKVPVQTISHTSKKISPYQQDVERLLEFHQKNKLKNTPLQFISDSFKDAIQCAKDGDVFSFFDKWEYKTAAPKAIRRVVKQFDDEETEELIEELKKLKQEYCKIVSGGYISK